MSNAEEDNGKKKVLKQTSMVSFLNKRPKRGRKKKKGRSGVGGRPSLSEQRARDKLIAEAEAEKIIVFNKRVNRLEWCEEFENRKIRVGDQILWCFDNKWAEGEVTRVNDDGEGLSIDYKSQGSFKSTKTNDSVSHFTKKDYGVNWVYSVLSTVPLSPPKRGPGMRTKRVLGQYVK